MMMSTDVPRDERRAYMHRFDAGAKQADTRCQCGKMTWAEAIAFWRQAPRRLILLPDQLIDYCTDARQ